MSRNGDVDAFTGSIAETTTLDPLRRMYAQQVGPAVVVGILGPILRSAAIPSTRFI